MVADTHLFKLRIPRALLDRIEAEAKRSRRSTTQEIVVAVETYVTRRGDQLPASAGGDTAAGQASQA